MENTVENIQQEVAVPEIRKSNKKYFGLIGLAVVIVLFGVGLLFIPTNKKTSSEKVLSATKTSETPAQKSLSANAGSVQDLDKLPLGDKKYTTTGPKKGYVYLCNARSDEGAGGAQAVGPWIQGSTWSLTKKPSVSGKVTWPNATFSNTISNGSRVLAGNDLPVGGTTGTFPVQSSDPVYKYDRNPNTIKAQQYSNTFPTNPTYATTPNCMGGEVGVMLNGVSLFNSFDATLRDAAANEVQDSCQGHPQKDGQYHYHSLSSCFSNISTTAVIGFALDGFPITGPKLASGKNLTTNDLDECHGITSEIILDGKKTKMYHYVMTYDFPYSVSCFRGKPVSMKVISQGIQEGAGQKNMTNKQQPPQEAFSACSGKSSGTSCTVTTPNGKLSGTCKLPPGQTQLVCVPSDQPRR